MATATPATPSTSTERDWTKPQAMAIPKEGYFQPEKGRYGQSFPRSRLLRLFSRRKGQAWPGAGHSRLREDY